MKTYLDKIVDYKKQELASLRRRVSLKDVQFQATDVPAVLPFLKNFKQGDINIIAEIKKASPSLGVIRQNFKPVDIALSYEEGGAKALSVLTDEHFFQGSLSFIEKIKQKVALPCLRKDFTLDEYHIYEARAAQADALLLIAAILDKHQLKDYYILASELGMTVLVEVHSQEEWEKIAFLNPSLVGVNNRNLETFEVSLDTSRRLVKNFPKTSTCISESGIKTRTDIDDLMKVGYQGFLIGETFMKELDPGKKLKELIEKK